MNNKADPSYVVGMVLSNWAGVDNAPCDPMIFCVTWNVGEVVPTANFDFTNLLALNSKVLPDLYAVGMQELKSSVGSIVFDSIYDDPWTNALTDCLGTKGYVRVESLRLLGMHLAVFVRRTSLPYIANIERAYTRSGPGANLGISTKGGVSVRMDIYGVSVCFVNCHFAAHPENYIQRIKDYTAIVESQQFQAPGCSNILDHDYVFWLGDLNFRIDGLPNEEVRKRAVERDFKYLLQFDQLLKAKKEELILLDFEEGLINFPPTFKFDVGTDRYDTSSKNRIPSWCDRILWHVHTDSFNGVELSVDLQHYGSIMNYTISDHKPVVAEFVIQVLAHPAELPVLFEPTGHWYQLTDNKLTYTVAEDLTVTSRDWIALYKIDYKHFRDYSTYVWASTDGEDVADGTRMYTVQFNREYLSRLPSGDYYLAYFSSSKNGIVGYSDLMQLSMKEDESSSSSTEASDVAELEDDLELSSLSAGSKSEPEFDRVHSSTTPPEPLNDAENSAGALPSEAPPTAEQKKEL